jgi:hypothetical protein
MGQQKAKRNVAQRPQERERTWKKEEEKRRRENGNMVTW